MMRSALGVTARALRASQRHLQRKSRHQQQHHATPPLCRHCSVDHGVDITYDEPAAEGDVVMVTGGNGFLGQHVIKQLQENATHVREIRVLDLWPFTPKLDYDVRIPVTSYMGSVTNRDDVRRTMWDVDSVIHVAGLISYGTFPDHKAMEKVNVDGTLNVLRGCLHRDVKRLLYCSTVDVVIGFHPIRDGGEEDTPVPERFLFPGYPQSKLQGERLVLCADGQPTRNGGKLHTLALRANVMYGELDPYYVTTALKSAKSMGGKLMQVGDGRAVFQQCYVGNAAAAFVQADRALRLRPHIGGQALFVPDDTALVNSFKFMEPFLESRGYTLSQVHLPYRLVHGLLYMNELLLRALSPWVKIHFKTAACSIQYINMDLFFRSEKARTTIDYSPRYSPKEAQERSLAYYKSMKL